MIVQKKDVRCAELTVAAEECLLEVVRRCCGGEVELDRKELRALMADTVRLPCDIDAALTLLANSGPCERR